MRILARTDDYQVTLHESPQATSGPLVITFGGQPTNISPSGFGTDFLLKHGFDTVYVAQRVGTQYQGLSTDTFFDVLAEHCKGRDVICYGSSLGGYAALYYGGVLDARIIAAAPMFPSWPPLNRKPFADLRITHCELKDSPRSSKQPVVIYDKHIAPDRFLVQNMVLPAYPNARLVEVEYTGHAVLIPIQRAGLLTDFILQLINNDTIIPLNLPTDTCHLWTLYKGIALLKEETAEARQLLRQSLALRPNRVAFEVLLGSLLRSDLVEDAQNLVDAHSTEDGPTFKINQGILNLMSSKGVHVATGKGANSVQASKECNL